MYSLFYSSMILNLVYFDYWREENLLRRYFSLDKNFCLLSSIGFSYTSDRSWLLISFICWLFYRFSLVLGRRPLGPSINTDLLLCREDFQLYTYLSFLTLRLYFSATLSAVLNLTVFLFFLTFCLFLSLWASRKLRLSWMGSESNLWSFGYDSLAVFYSFWSSAYSVFNFWISKSLNILIGFLGVLGLSSGLFYLYSFEYSLLSELIAFCLRPSFFFLISSIDSQR